ncbi:MAG: sulfatase-like hydrolase/transferase, partial [Bradymonadaceae bacterium]
MKSKLKETIPKIAFLAIPLTILAVDFFVRWDGRIPAMVWSRPENLLVSIGLSVILWWAVSRLVGLSKRPWLWAALISFPTAMLLCAAWRYRQVTHNDASVGILLYAWGEPGNALGFAPHGFSAGFAVAVIILASLWTLSLAVWRGELSQFSRRLCMTMPAVWVMAGFVAPPGIPVYGSPYLSDLHVNQLMGEATLRIVRGDAGSVLDVAQRLPMPKVEWADRPNIIVIVVESLRYDRVSAFGYERDTTPRMKAFMEARNEEVFVFERAYTPSPYSPLAMASVLTGLYPSRTKEELHQVPVLWQYAEAYGAKSFLITPQDWTLAGLTEFFLVDGAPELSVTAQNFHAPVVNDTGVHDGLAAERIARYFREDLGSDDRFLGVIKPNAPHFPFLSAEDLPWPVENIRDRYDGSVRLTDELFGTLIDVLEETGRLDDTIIIYTSDHSEFFYNLDG